MTFGELLSTVGAGEILKSGGLILLLLSIVLQIAPIKINPWGWIAKKIGRAINGEVITKVDKLDRDLQEVRARSEEEAILTSRVRILRFGDEIIHGVAHSKDHFDQTLQDIDKYERFCDEHKDFANSITGMTVRQIRDSYRRRCEKNDFM